MRQQTIPAPSEKSVINGYVPTRPRLRPITRYLCCLLLTAIALAASLDCSIGLISRLLNSIFLNQHWRISYSGGEFFLKALPAFAWMAIAFTGWHFRRKR
jgi:hypothetical protein